MGTVSSNRRKKPGWRNALKNVAVFAVGCGLLFLAEGVLTLVGVRPMSEEDLFIGFEGTLPLFVEAQEGGGPGYVLNPVKYRCFNPQSFRQPKPEGVFCIIAFGGSTTYGQPYIDNTSFPKWTEVLLGRYDATHKHESINAGGISYASYRVRRLMDELAQFSPDLYVLYSGHNEFLEARTFAGLAAESPLRRRLRGLLHRLRLYSLVRRGLRAVAGDSGESDQTVLGDEVDAILEQGGGPGLYHRDPQFRAGVI